MCEACGISTGIGGAHCELWYEPDKYNNNIEAKIECSECNKVLRSRSRRRMASCRFGMQGTPIVRY